LNASPVTVMQDNRVVQLTVPVSGTDPQQIADRVVAAARQAQRDPSRMFGSRPSRLN
jgi:hypothetical protein